jgi:hypothetical protein
MKTFLYLLPIEHDQEIKDLLRMVSKPPTECYSGPMVMESKLIDLVGKAERVETDQGLDARNLVIPEDKICVGIMVEHSEGENVHRTECDMFADHPEFEHPVGGLANRMDRAADVLIDRLHRPNKTTSYAWTYNGMSGYKALRLCGRYS